MKIMKTLDRTVHCVLHPDLRAQLYGGHIHNKDNFDHVATAGWCKMDCSDQIESSKCGEFIGGCYGSREFEK